MKKFLVLIASLTLVSVAYGDIHEPPASKYGRTRKLSRGLANIAYGSQEFPYQIAATNEQDGGNAAASLGIAKGIRNTVVRIGYGVYEVVTFPLPTTKGDFRPPYRSVLRYREGGLHEFPPELGFSSRYSYARDYNNAP